MTVLEEKKYITNSLLDIVFLDNGNVAVKNLNERFCIKGEGVSNVVVDIIELFGTSHVFSEAINSLSLKYNAHSLRRLMDLFVDKGVLIEHSEYLDMSCIVNEDMKNALMYTSASMSLNKIIETAEQHHIGIIGGEYFVTVIYDVLKRFSLPFNVKAIITDNDIMRENIKSLENATYISSLDSKCKITELVEASTFVIAASNGYDHQMFYKVNELCMSKRIEWLRIVIDGVITEIGPLFISNNTACYSCLHENHKRNMTPDEFVFDNLYYENKLDKSLMGYRTLFPLVDMSASISCSEMIKYICGMKCNLREHVLMINGMDISTQKGRIYKNNNCSICGEGKEIC